LLRRPQDVEDAAQETFLKLLRHAPDIRGSLKGWLAATARATAIDLIRRSVREHRRRQRLSPRSPSTSSSELMQQSLDGQLQRALGELDGSRRALVVEHYLHHTPIRVLAGRLNLSVSRTSRRLTSALEELAGVLGEMHVAPGDQPTLLEHLGASSPRWTGTDEALRFAADWSAIAQAPGAALQPAYGCLPGWTRPLRVGILISYRSTMVIGQDGQHWPADLQLLTTRWIGHQGIQLVSIVEGDSVERGPIERAMREHELVGGLIDVCDIEALETLDVILLGWNRSLSARAAAAIHRAVRSGVGLLNEYWTGSYEMMRSSATIQDLMLAGSPIHAHHAASHGQMAPGHVVGEHALLPGLKVGMGICGRGCGPVYHPAPGAKVLAVSDLIVCDREHGIAGLGPIPMPICLTGELGRGRVWVVHTFAHDRLAPQLPLPFEAYLRDLLLWLADPRRE
jgi:RNA polymerase sigma factor (sigma-70 family)